MLDACSLLFFFFSFLLLFRAVPKAYGSSQVRGRIGAVASCIYHSHINARFKPSLRQTPQLTARLDP